MHRHSDITERFGLWSVEGTGDRLYGCVHLPADHSNNHGGPAVLLVPSVGRERLRCYRELASLARSLAARGFAVGRFDWRGEGESTGVFAETGVASRLDDLELAARRLREEAGTERLALLGAHLGATLAAAGAQRVGARRLVLWDPITAPSQYARTLLRSNVVLQTQYFGQVTRKAPALRQALEAGETVSVYGFQLGLRLLQELEALDPAPALSAFDGRALVLYSAPKEVPPRRDLAAWVDALSQQGQARSACCVMPFSWTSRRRWMPTLPALNAAVGDWLEENR